MVSVNLIPAHRHGARKRRKRLRRWIGLCAGYAALLLVVCAVGRALWGTSGQAVAEEFDRAGREIAESKQQIAQLQQKLFQSQRLLAANRVLADQPDWSILLALISKTLGQEVVLTSCLLRPADARPGPEALLSGPVADPAGGFVLGVRGFGKSQAAVANFVLRLEQTGLFKAVKTIKANREPFGQGEAIAFQLDCLLANRSGG